MNPFIQALTLSAILLPAFMGAALLLAVLLRGRDAEQPWLYRDIVSAFCTVAALVCVALAVLLARSSTPDPREEAAKSAPVIEVDMLVTRGNGVDVYLNDWQHPAERVPVVAGQRHVYRFLKLPRQIALVRLDPTDVPDAEMVIYSLTVKAGSQTIRQFGPAELKTWTLANLSAPHEENGGLAMHDTNDDPILWSPLAQAITVPESKPPEKPSLLQLYYRPALLVLAALLLAGLARMAKRKGRLATLLSRPFPTLPAFCRDILLSPWCAAVLVLLAAAGTVLLQTQAASSDVVLEVDMMVSRGVGVDLYLNDWQHPPERLPVIPGQRHVYRFLKLPSKINLFRLDPTDLADARIVIYSLTVRNSSRIFRQFGPTELKSWSRTNLSEAKEEDGGLALTDTNDDPVLTYSLELLLPGGLLQALSPLIETTDAPFLLVITLFLLVLLARMSTRTGRMQALLIAVASGLVYPVVLLFLQLDLMSPPPVKTAVGYVSYIGYDKGNEFLAATVAMLICLALAYAFARFAGRAEEQRDEMLPDNRRRWPSIAHAVVFVVLFLFFLPNLQEIFKSVSATVYRFQGWDAINSLTWSYLISTGLRPVRDFWYPYSGSYIQFLPFPMDVISGISHAIILLWVLYLALFKVTGRRVLHALVILSLVATPGLLNMLPGWNRYLLSVDVALLYVAIRDASRWEWKMHTFFVLFVGYVFFYEPTQVIYATTGMAADIALSVIARFQGRSLRERLLESAKVLKQRLVYTVIPLLAGITASLLVFAWNGMLPGLWDFERSLGDQGDYSGWPSEISRWVQPDVQPDTIFLLMFLLASYTAYRWFRLKDQQDGPLGAALVVLSTLTFVAMQKQILRPHTMTQLRLFPYVTALIFGLLVWRERKPFVRIVIAVFIGCILGIAFQRKLLREVYRQDIATGPGKMMGTIEALLHERNDFDRVNATMYSRSRFIGFDVENAVVDHLTQVAGLRTDESVYVLGDSNIFYMLLNRRPPYDSNTYNESPIYEQQKVIDWFHRQKPRFVIWGANDLTFDNVPHIVRLPLIFSYVVEHYQLLQVIGQYQILVELSPDQAPDLAYWRRVLGERVNLGHIPALARPSEYEACGGDVTRCDAVLVVKYPQSKPVPRGKMMVDFDAPGGPLGIQFDVSPATREYVVNLNRLWFWNPLSRAKPPRITAKDAAVEVIMEYRRERSPVLY